MNFVNSLLKYNNEINCSVINRVFSVINYKMNYLSIMISFRKKYEFGVKSSIFPVSTRLLFPDESSRHFIRIFRNIRLEMNIFCSFKIMKQFC